MAWNGLGESWNRLLDIHWNKRIVGSEDAFTIVSSPKTFSV